MRADQDLEPSYLVAVSDAVDHWIYRAFRVAVDRMIHGHYSHE